MDPTLVGLVGVAVLLSLLFLGVHVAIAMVVVGVVGFAVVVGPEPALNVIGLTIFGTLSDFNMSVMPLFIVMGTIAAFSGISDELYDVAHKWLGRLPGGLALTSIGACAAFAAISGTSSATAATMTKVALPQMRKYNYAPSLASGSLAAGGTLGILIPPSVVFAFYGLLTEQSVGKLFIAGIVPGIILAFLFCVVILVQVSLNPALGPKGPSVPWRVRLAALRGVWAVVVLFGLVVGGLYFGIFTASEAGGIGAFGALIIGLIKRKINRKNLPESLTEGVKLTAMIMMMVACAYVFNKFVLVTQLPANAALLIAALEVNRWFVFAAMMVIYFILGAIMDMTAMLVLTIPIFYPLIVSLGFDPIWFGVILVIMVELAMMTPPIGLNVFIIAGMQKEVSMGTIFRGTIPFWFAIGVIVVLLAVFPEIALFLVPN